MAFYSFLLILTTSILSALLISCKEFKDDKKNQAPQSPSAVNANDVKTENNPFEDKTFGLELIEEPEPFKYSLRFSWPKTLGKVRFYYERTNDNPSLELGDTTGSQNSLQTISLIATEEAQTGVFLLNRKFKEGEITFFIEHLDESLKLQSKIRKTIKIPKDTYINNLYSLTKDTKLESHRIFFGEKARIQTNGFLFKIQTDEIFSESGSEILTFPEGTKADRERNGRTPLNISILSKKAHGQLKIILRGENGGDGIDGRSYTMRAKDGDPGSDGVSGEPCLHIESQNICTCLKPPTKAKNGSNGAPGNPGTNGRPGGNSGKAFVHIEEAEKEKDFYLQIEKVPGIGGIKGNSGPGQEGGWPGAFHGKPGPDCPPPVGDEPKKGETGPLGPPALDGLSGKEEESCLSIGLKEVACRP